MDSPLALDTAACDRARLARDARFDGVFFTAVRSTGIYCRPVCPAPPPKPRNITYFPTAALPRMPGTAPACAAARNWHRRPSRPWPDRPCSAHWR